MDAAIIIQARMGSSRLPGKVMLPLDGVSALVHEIGRAASVVGIDRDDIVVATSREVQDDIIDITARETGAMVYRGSENDVIGRVANAVKDVGADVAVRLCGDNTLIDPRLPETLFDEVRRDSVTYASSKFKHTFPLGHNADAFTCKMIVDAAKDADSDHHREHIAQYFKENRDKISTANVTAEKVFGDELVNSVPELAELRLTLDEADDYRLLSRIYEELTYDRIVDTTEAIRHILDNDLQQINAAVDQEVW